MAALTDWVLTLWQTVPRLGTVLRNLQPTLHLPDLRAIDAELLQELGIRAIIWDIDGTVMPSHAPAVHPELAPSFVRLIEDPSLKHVVLSNSGERRYTELGTIFPAIPILRAYKVKDGVSYRRLLQGAEAWSGASSPASGRKVIKKPDRMLIEFALKELEIDDRDRVLMVGDQYFTDVAGANLAGIRSVKVNTLERSSFALPVRTFQRAEAVVYRVLHGRPKLR